MKKQKLTDWFPPNVKPVHKGMYEVHVSHCYPFPRYFDGKKWHIMTRAEASGTKPFTPCSVDYGYHWRGLAEKPE